MSRRILKAFWVAGVVFGLSIAPADHCLAGTIPFTFTVAGVGSVDGPPSPAQPTVGTTLLAVADFSPFGSAAYSELGTLTFGFFAPDVFAIESLATRFTASFNGGSDSFTGSVLGVFQAPTATGQEFSVSWLIDGGSGIFSGANGQATAIGIGRPDSDRFSGSGLISAPGLASTPEPAGYSLFCAGGLFVIALRYARVFRKDVQSTSC